MSNSNTHFAPSERYSLDEIKQQARVFQDNPSLLALVNNIALAVVILNDRRQLIFANTVFVQLVGASGLDPLLGQRVGEAIACIHAFHMEGGCGTSPFCRHCGVVRSMLSAIQGLDSKEDCRISLDGDSMALDLRVKATPLVIDEQRYSFFSIENIADEKRREALERLFLHDVKNTAGGLYGIGNLCLEAVGDDMAEMKEMFRYYSRQLMDEIDAYALLASAEDRTLRLNIEAFSAFELLRRVADLYASHSVAEGKEVVITDSDQDLIIESDELLMRRVLGNLVKNALEACEAGDRVSLSCKRSEGGLKFRVHNPGFMSETVKSQIFQRSFSTKGKGRGLGTYSIRLFGESYLGGKLDFSSEKEDGTVFYADFPLRFS